ncbi:MAG: DUF3127 domain-containing protein [Gloeomargaritales cyanobacterium]
MQIEGKIKLVNATQAVSDKFSKRTLVVVTSDTYPQEIEIQFTQDKCSLLDGLFPGAEVTIGVNLRGRCWVNTQGEEKYFNTIEGWKVDATLPSITPTPSAPSTKAEDMLPF